MPSQYLSGSDYLMLGFDHELRAHGFAGNLCQIVLELGSPISPGALEKRLEALASHYPILNARAAGWLTPRWNLPRSPAKAPRVRVHTDEPALCQSLLNESLATNRGELTRFDVIAQTGGRMKLIFTWAHALMDAHSAEHFLALVGREDVPLPSPDSPPPPRAKLGLRDRGRLAWKNLHHIDQFCLAAPRCPGSRFPDAAASVRYRVERFSAEETARVRGHSARHCGLLGDTQYHTAVAVMELHQLHLRLGSPSPSYVLPVPVGLRPKGKVEPLFSNQITMLMLQFLPKDLGSLGQAIAVLKTQTEHAMRTGLVDSGVFLLEMFRFLPLSIYVAFMKHGLHGEICSLYYGNSAAVSPLVTSFLGVPIEDFTHAAAVPPSPGFGVIFYYFRGELRVTVMHSARVLTDAEAAEFAAGLRSRLLNP